MAAKKPAKKPVAKKSAAKKPSKKEDDDLALLDQQMAVAKTENAKLNKSKAEDDKKKAAAAKEEKAALLAQEAACRKAAPIYVEEVAERIQAINKGYKTTGGNPCWVSYVLNNFLSAALEKKRRVHMHTAGVPEGEGEPVLSFEVHDDVHPDDSHSWNVVTTATGSYALDLSLDQFLPSGKYGYKKDASEEPGTKPVKAASRLLTANAAEGAAAHKGVIAIDRGILPEGPVEAKKGVEIGTAKKYAKFLASAQLGRFKDMTKDERRSAEILHRAKMVPQWIKVVEELDAMLVI